LGPLGAGQQHASTSVVPREPDDGLLARLQAGFASLFSGSGNGDSRPPPPSMIDVLATSINIMQVRITRSRLAGEPADVVITPPPPMSERPATRANIMQVPITRSRLAAEPAEVVLAPRLAHFALLDFHRAAEAIEEGRRAAEAVLPQIRSLLGPSQPPSGDHP